MPRKIYENAIYSREKQMDRKVYQRANNVLPVTEQTTENTEPATENIEPTVENTEVNG